MDGDQLDREVLALAQLAQAHGDMAGGVDQHVGHPLRLFHRRLDAVQTELVGGLFGVVDDVVARTRERMHVGRVERTDAALGQPAQDLVGDPVALVLAVEYLARDLGALRIFGEQVTEQARSLLHVAA